MKNTRVFGLFALLAIAPSVKAEDSYLKTAGNFITGLGTGSFLGSATVVNKEITQYIYKSITANNPYYVNALPAAISAVVIELVSMFGAEYVREYFAQESDVAFYTHWITAAGVTTAGVYDSKYTAITLFAALKAAVMGTKTAEDAVTRSENAEDAATPADVTVTPAPEAEVATENADVNATPAVKVEDAATPADATEKA